MAAVKYTDEVFWVEQPGILLSWSCEDNNYVLKENKQLRGGAARWNDVTKILIVVSLVLLILKATWWWIFLVVALLIIVVAYYNTHPPPSSRRNKEDQTNSKEGFNMAIKEDTKFISRSDNDRPFKTDTKKQYEYIDRLTGESETTPIDQAKRRTASRNVVIHEDIRPRLSEKQQFAREKEQRMGQVKLRGGRVEGLDAPRLQPDDEFSNGVSYAVDNAQNVQIERSQIEGVDKTTKKYTMNYPVKREQDKDAFQMYLESFDDEERRDVNLEVERSHESAISGLETSFVYKK